MTPDAESTKPTAGISLPELESLLENLEKRIATTEQPERRARMFNLAGDMCLDALQLERGLSYYDKAITTYTAADQYETAAKICEKIVALKTNAVRPFFTLALLAIRQGKIEQGRRCITQYVDAAEDQKLGKVARGYLLDLAELTDDPTLLESIAEGLMQLNDSAGANTIYGRMHQAGGS